MKKFFWAVGLCIISPSVILAADPQSVHEYQLKNGLKLIVKEDHRAPVVFSSIWYKVGGSYEPSGLTGISHALEHMMFRGTTQYGPGKLAAIINQHGGDQNAMTDEDFTVYFQTLPVEQLALSFELESDRMQHLLLDPAAFAKEIQVVMEERRMRTEDDPQALANERFNAIAFINNPYRHPVVGWMSDLLQMKVEDLRNWYHQWYAPNNAIIVVVGDVNPDQVLSLATQYFAAIPAVNLPVVKLTQEVSALGTRHLNVHIPAELSWISLSYNTPSLTTVDRDSGADPYALTVLACILGNGESSRLNRELVRGKQTAASASADYSPYNLHANLLSISATPAATINPQDLEKSLENEILQLQTKLVSPEELQRAKAQIISSHIFGQDSLMSEAFNLGNPEAINLSWQVENEFVSRIKTITAEQIQAVAKRYLIPENLTVGILEPSSMKKTPTSTRGESHANASAIH